MPLPRMRKNLYLSTFHLCLSKTGEEALQWIQKDLKPAQVSDFYVLCLSEPLAFRKSSWSVPRAVINACNCPVAPMDKSVWFQWKIWANPPGQKFYFFVTNSCIVAFNGFQIWKRNKNVISWLTKPQYNGKYPTHSGTHEEFKNCQCPFSIRITAAAHIPYFRPSS